MASKLIHNVGTFLPDAPNAAKNIETILRKSVDSEIESLASKLKKGPTDPLTISKVIARVERIRRQIAHISSAYVRYVFVNVDSVLNGNTPGLQNIRSLYSGQVKYKVPKITKDNRVLEASGFTRRISPKHAMRWQRLNERYINKDPISKSFWRKRGALAKYFDASTDKLKKQVFTAVDYTKTPVRSHRSKWKVIVPIKLLYPELGVLWNSYILQPFATGEIGQFPIIPIPSRTASKKADAKERKLRNWRKGKDTSRETINILTFIEQRQHKHGGRPFIKALSVEMGLEMRKALRRL